MRRGLYERLGKRCLDLVASALLVVVLSPVLILIAILVWASHGRPVLFRQRRPGLHGAPFTLLKFRSMSRERDSSGDSLPDSARMTPVGVFLRRTSLDELPELFNVLRGDMSLVGPRPLLMDYLPLYSTHQMRRHLVRPGITGLAQVSGRNLLSWEDKFRLDTFYVDHLSFRADLVILGQTVLAVISGHGVSQDGVVTAERFTGSPK